MSQELTRGTVVQACLVMLVAANKQNEELRELVKELRAERAEMVKYVKSVDGLGDKVVKLSDEMQEQRQNWILTASAICAVSSATGVTPPLCSTERELMRELVDEAAVLAHRPSSSEATE